MIGALWLHLRCSAGELFLRHRNLTQVTQNVAPRNQTVKGVGSKLEMNERARKARAEYYREYHRNYMREWRKKNPEKVKEIKVRFYERLAERMEKDANSQ